MRRIMIDMDDAILRQLKLRAASQGRPLQAVVNDLLRRAVRLPVESPYKLDFPSWKGIPNPSVAFWNRKSLWETMQSAGDEAVSWKRSR